jgi:hypothetical protein
MKNTRAVLVTVLLALLGSACESVTRSDGLSEPGFVASSQEALIAPDDDLHRFPPWIWPYIRTTNILTHVLEGQKFDVEEASARFKQSAFEICEYSTTGKYRFEDLLELVNINFDMQHNALRLARVQSLAHGGRALDGEDVPRCGNDPYPWPVPWPWLKVIANQSEVLKSELARLYKLDPEQQAILDKQVGQQLARFERLMK